QARTSLRIREIARDIGDDVTYIQTLANAVEAYREGGDVAAAIASTDEALILARRLRNPSILCNALTAAAMARWEADPDQALARVSEGLPIAESLGNQLGIIILLVTAINIRIIQARWHEAIPLTLRMMTESHQAGDRINLLGAKVYASLL